MTNNKNIQRVDFTEGYVLRTCGCDLMIRRRHPALPELGLALYGRVREGFYPIMPISPAEATHYIIEDLKVTHRAEWQEILRRHRTARYRWIRNTGRVMLRAVPWIAGALLVLDVIFKWF